MVDIAELLADLAAESDEVDRLVAQLPERAWALPTPAPGWTIMHQIAHLTWTDRASTTAITDPDAFAASLIAAWDNLDGYVDRGAEELLDVPPVVLTRWREGRAGFAAALSRVPAGEKIPWYGTAMSPVSMATARLMETWAHGLDIADALGVTPVPTARLRHIAHLGHRTFRHSFGAHGRPAPDGPVRVELTAPDGTLWTFGPADAPDRVTGPAWDFCLLVTRRRNRADLDLTATGAGAEEWLDVAQAFAGPPGPGRPANQTAAANQVTSADQAGTANQVTSADQTDFAGRPPMAGPTPTAERL